MTHNSEISAHVRAADLEIARVMQRIAPIAGLIAARQRLKAALELIEGVDKQEQWSVQEILDYAG